MWGVVKKFFIYLHFVNSQREVINILFTPFKVAAPAVLERLAIPSRARL